MIDPQDPRAYREAILDWTEPHGGEHAEMLDLYRRLIACAPPSPTCGPATWPTVRVEFDEAARWMVVHRGGFRVAVNLAAEPQQLPVAAGEMVLATGEADRPDGLRWRRSAAILRV